MRRMIRLDRAAGLACTIAGLVLLVGFLSPGPAVAAGGPASITDPGGDTINRDTSAKLAAPAADIVAATVDSGAGGIVLSFRTQQMGNPASDVNWGSGNTSASWQLDDNNDGKVDDIITYSADTTVPGGIAGSLVHWPGQNAPPQRCTVPAAFDPVAGYTMTVDPGCVGKPAAISYRVQLTYDTSPGTTTKPPLAFDVAPDQGLAGPVPIVVPTAPAAAPPPTAAAPGPGATASPPSSAAAPAAKPATPPVTRAAPKPATPSTAAARRPSSAAPSPAVPPAARTAPAGGLAATGADTRTLGAFGAVLLLLGGLALMARAGRRRTA
jgi:hypothetical protein